MCTQKPIRKLQDPSVIHQSRESGETGAGRKRLEPSASLSKIHSWPEKNIFWPTVIYKRILVLP